MTSRAHPPSQRMRIRCAVDLWQLQLGERGGGKALACEQLMAKSKTSLALLYSSVTQQQMHVGWITASTCIAVTPYTGL